MKRVFRNAAEVAHIWAQQTQDEGRTPTSHCYFVGPRIYSYGSHFMIARFTENNIGQKCVLFTLRDYSVTTSSHKQDVLGALRGLDYPVFKVVHPENEPDERVLLEVYTGKMNNAITKAAKARKHAEGYLADANLYVDQFNEIAEFFGFVARLSVPADSVKAAKEAVAKAKEAAKKAAERHTLDLQVSEITNAPLIAAWRACERKPDIKWVGPQLERTLLRVNGDQIETSRHAYVPVEHAKRLWPHILKAKTEGVAPKLLNSHIGHYSVNEITKDGDIRVGCHFIEYREIELIARQLNLVQA